MVERDDESRRGAAGDVSREPTGQRLLVARLRVRIARFEKHDRLLGRLNRSHGSDRGVLFGSAARRQMTSIAPPTSVQSGDVHKEGASAGVTLVAALVSS